MRVVVHRIESIKDTSGNIGKRVELVEENLVPSYAIRPPNEEARIIQDVFKTLQQQIPFFGTKTQMTSPKIILFLTEQEYEQLGVQFDVNQRYEIELGNHSLVFKRFS